MSSTPHTSWLSSTDVTGAYQRKPSQFRTTALPTPIDPNRYHVYVSYACPWASRVLFARTFFGLESALSVDVVDPFLGPGGWAFHKPEGAPAYRPGVEENEQRDSVNNFRFLREVYLQTNPDYEGNITVPVLYDKVEKRIVNNESSEILRILNSDFRPLHTRNTHVDLYPVEGRDAIDEVNEFVYQFVNNGVYRCGFARSQEAFSSAFEKLFETLDRLEAVLSKQRYLTGSTLTEADVRAFTTFVRFDSVYHTHFKCNKRSLHEYPALLNYTRELYQLPGIDTTVNDAHIRFHYYQSHTSINPTQIVPLGPQTDLTEPHNRGEIAAEE